MLLINFIHREGWKKNIQHTHSLHNMLQINISSKISQKEVLRLIRCNQKIEMRDSCRNAGTLDVKRPSLQAEKFWNRKVISWSSNQTAQKVISVWRRRWIIFEFILVHTDTALALINDRSVQLSQFYLFRFLYSLDSASRIRSDFCGSGSLSRELDYKQFECQSEDIDAAELIGVARIYDWGLDVSVANGNAA